MQQDIKSPTLAGSAHENPRNDGNQITIKEEENEATWEYNDYDLAKNEENNSTSKNITKTNPITEQQQSQSGVLLFVRLPKQNYIYLGKLLVESFDFSTRPLKFLLHLADYQSLRENQRFLDIVFSSQLK